MSQNVRRTKVSRMTLLALLVAVLIVLAYVNIPPWIATLAGYLAAAEVVQMVEEYLNTQTTPYNS